MSALETWAGPALVWAVVLPIAGAALCLPLGWVDRRLARVWASVAASGASVAALVAGVAVTSVGPLSYELGGWAAPYGIELRIDEFGAIMGFASPVFVMAVVFGVRYAASKFDRRGEPLYHALMLLNLGGILGFAFTGDLFNLFVFMEILSLSAYALVTYGDRAVTASFRYLVIGALSSLLILFAIGMLYQMTGSLNMSDIAALLERGAPTRPSVFAFGALSIGFMTKAALFPLHLWLPEAHSAAPSPVSAVLSGVVVKVGVLGLIRTYQVFERSEAVDTGVLDSGLAVLGALAIVLGALLALLQDDVKMMLAYSTVSNIGYIAVGLGLANESGHIGAAVHVLNHAVIKAALFLAIGAIIFRTGLRTLSDLRGIGRCMPVTTGAFSLAVIAVAGIPPTAGFVTKWYLAVGAIEAARPALAGVLVFSALLVLVYYLRMLNAFYFRPPASESVQSAKEAPLSMLVPIVALAAASLALGLLARFPVEVVSPGAARLIGGG